MTFRLKGLIVAGFAITIAACQKQDTTCDGSTRTYDADIKAILDANCNSCHSPSGNRADYSSYSKITPILNSGLFSRRVLENQDMPQFSTLSQADLVKIQCWADNGYPEN